MHCIHLDLSVSIDFGGFLPSTTMPHLQGEVFSSMTHRLIWFENFENSVVSFASPALGVKTPPDVFAVEKFVISGQPRGGQ